MSKVKHSSQGNVPITITNINVDGPGLENNNEELLCPLTIRMVFYCVHSSPHTQPTGARQIQFTPYPIPLLSFTLLHLYLLLRLQSGAFFPNFLTKIFHYYYFIIIIVVVVVVVLCCSCSLQSSSI